MKKVSFGEKVVVQVGGKFFCPIREGLLECQLVSYQGTTVTLDITLTGAAEKRQTKTVWVNEGRKTCLGTMFAWKADLPSVTFFGQNENKEFVFMVSR